MITAEAIRRLAPRARQDYVDALVAGGETFERFGINTPLRLAAFLATICHETGGLTIVRESGNYSASRIRAVWPTRPEAVKFAGNAKGLFNSVYGSRMGNQHNGTNDDDGYRYRGGGMIQLTGKWSYEQAGKAIGVDLGAEPELIEDATVSLQAACWEFSQHLKYCDMGDRGWKAVCNAINRGNPISKLDPIGWADRQIWYSRCCDVLGISGKIEDDLLTVGDRGELVKALQERLNALGYAVGRSDGIFGPRTRSAVLTFQAENELSTDGIIGPKTRTVLNAETAVPMPLGERATETKADLKEAGSTTIAATDKLKTAATATMAVSTAAGAAQETGLLQGAGDLLKELNLLKTTTSGFVDIVNWATGHWYIAAVIIGFLVWKWAKDIEFRRVLEHNFGLNLSR
jgi:putative chitinase